MVEEITNPVDEEKLLQKVRAKKRVRGLLIGINALLACYLVFEIVMKVTDYISSLNDESEIIPLNGNSKNKSLEIYDTYLLKNEHNQYITSDAYDLGIYGGYLHLSPYKMSNGHYHSFNTTSMINVSNQVQASVNQKTDKEFLNTGINLSLLEKGDYLIFSDYITENNFSSKHKAIKFRSEKGIEKTIYTLPNENKARKKITIKSKDSSPSLVISVNEINSLPKEYYDYVFIGDEEKIDTYLSNNHISSDLKVYKTNSLLEAFKVQSNYCLILNDEQDVIIPSYLQIKDNLNGCVKYNDDIIINEMYSFKEYFNELGGSLTDSGSCQEGIASSFITKPYLQGYDIGKFTISIPMSISLSEIAKLF